LLLRLFKQKATKHYEPATKLSGLLQDSQRFVQEFRIPIVASASQLYISALAYCPKSTHIYRALSDQCQNMVHVTMGADEGWEKCIATLEGHGSTVGLFLAQLMAQSTFGT
jgi:hypothetical protein